MEANTAVQFNSNYIKLLVNAKLNGLPFGQLQVIGEIFSFTGEAKGGTQMTCFRSYKKFTERCSVSRATVGRALKFGRDNDIIEFSKEVGFSCKIKPTDGLFNRLPAWVCQDEFEVHKGKKRKLKFSERAIYAYLYTHCTGKGNRKHELYISYTQLAEKTGYSERTVARTVPKLIRAKLIYRNKDEKGVNAYSISRYVLNYKLVLEKEKSAKQIKKEIEKTMRQTSEEPVEVFPYSSNDLLGNEEFIFHRPKPYCQRKSPKSIDMPEMQKYKTGKDIEFKFNMASNEELIGIYRRYNAVFEYLSPTQEAFIALVRYELIDRGLSPPRG